MHLSVIKRMKTILDKGAGTGCVEICLTDGTHFKIKIILEILEEGTPHTHITALQDNDSLLLVPISNIHHVVIPKLIKGRMGF